MEEQDLHVDPNFQKGFNGGYILAKYEPEILSVLTNSDNQESQLFKGMKAGEDQFSKDKEIEKDKAGFQKHRSKDDKDKE